IRAARPHLRAPQPWPSMLRGIFKDGDRYRKTYWSKFPGVYFAGDGARGPVPRSFSGVLRRDLDAEATELTGAVEPAPHGDRVGLGRAGSPVRVRGDLRPGPGTGAVRQVLDGTEGPGRGSRPRLDDLAPVSTVAR